MLSKSETIPLNEVIKLGQKADPVILGRIRQHKSREFRPSLSYHFETGGKRVRAAMVFLACGAAGGNVRDAIIPAAVVEMIHNYSLVMDDIIDHADVRRGRPSVRARMGDSVALLIAMEYRELLDELIEQSPARQKIRPAAVKAMTEIIDGERLDLQFEQSGRSDPYLLSHRILRPKFDLYLDMIGKKTASLFCTAGKVGGFAANADKTTIKRLGAFGWNTGLAFQIMDDILDIVGSETGKQRAKDVIEHKLGNAVVLVGLKFMQGKNRARLMSILQTEKVTGKMAGEARRLIAETPAEKTCRQIVQSYANAAVSELDILPNSRFKDALISLGENMVNRSF